MPTGESKTPRSAPTDLQKRQARGSVTFAFMQSMLAGGCCNDINVTREYAESLATEAELLADAYLRRIA